MSDNVGATPGTGVLIAADDLGGGVKAVVDKMGFGPDGTLIRVDAVHGSAMPVEGVATGTPINVAIASGSVGITGTVPVSGAFYPATQPVSIATTVAVGIVGQTGDLSVSNQGTFAVQAAQSGTWTVALGAGSAVIGHVVVDSGSLAVTNAGTFAVQAAQSGTWTVALSAGSAVIGHVVVDSGTVTANAGTGNFTVVQATGTNLHTVVDSGTITTVTTVGAVTAITNALPAGANTIGNVGLVAGTAVIGHVIVDSGAIVVTNAGTFAVQAAQSGTWNVTVNAALPAGTAILGKVGIDQTTAGTTNGVSLVQLGTTAVDVNSGTKSAGTLRVVLATDQPALTSKLLVTPDSVALPNHQSTNVDQWAGTGVDTNSGNKSGGTLRVVLATDQPALTNKILVTPDAVACPVTTATTGGATPYTYVSSAGTNAQFVKASPGTLYGIQVGNTNASPRWLKVFNKASAPTVGSDTPVGNFIIPGNTAGAGTNINLGDMGMALGTGISFAITGGAALLDNTSVTGSEITLNLQYA